MPDATDPLAQLKGIHLPPEVSFWPLSPTAWLLVALLSLVITFVGFKAVRYGQKLRQQKKRQQWAQQQLETIQAQAEQRPQEACAALNVLLKRAALDGGSSSSASRIAGLQGNAWIAWLGNHGGKALENYSDWLIEGPYRPLSSPPPAELFNAAGDYLNQHWAAPAKRKKTPKQTKLKNVSPDQELRGIERA